MRQGQERREQIVEFVGDYWAAQRMAPSIAEIAAHMGITASAVRRHVEILCDEGRLLVNPGFGRTVRLPRGRTIRKKAS